jgi:hypothetical protein
MRFYSLRIGAPVGHLVERRKWSLGASRSKTSKTMATAASGAIGRAPALRAAPARRRLRKR